MMGCGGGVCHPEPRAVSNLGTVAGNRLGDTGGLASGEVVHARVIAVVHVVPDAVNTAAGAAVLTNGASRGGGGRGGSVADKVARARAAALEDVVETEPVANLVGEGAALVVGGERATGVGVPLDNDTVVLGSAGVVPGEGGVAEQAVGEVDGVDVEGVGSTVTEGVLHRRLSRGTLVDVAEPVAVGDSLGALEEEGDAGASVVLVKDVDRGLDLGSGELAAGAVGDSVPRDGDRGGALGRGVDLHVGNLGLHLLLGLVVDLAVVTASTVGHTGTENSRGDGKEGSENNTDLELHLDNTI